MVGGSVVQRASACALLLLCLACVVEASRDEKGLSDQQPVSQPSRGDGLETLTDSRVSLLEGQAERSLWFKNIGKRVINRLKNIVGDKLKGVRWDKKKQARKDDDDEEEDEGEEQQHAKGGGQGQRQQNQNRQEQDAEEREDPERDAEEEGEEEQEEEETGQGGKGGGNKRGVTRTEQVKATTKGGTTRVEARRTEKRRTEEKTTRKRFFRVITDDKGKVVKREEIDPSQRDTAVQAEKTGQVRKDGDKPGKEQPPKDRRPELQPTESKQEAAARREMQRQAQQEEAERARRKRLENYKELPMATGVLKNGKRYCAHPQESGTKLRYCPHKDGMCCAGAGAGHCCRKGFQCGTLPGDPQTHCFKFSYKPFDVQGLIVVKLPPPKSHNDKPSPEEKKEEKKEQKTADRQKEQRVQERMKELKAKQEGKEPVPVEYLVEAGDTKRTLAYRFQLREADVPKLTVGKKVTLPALSYRKVGKGETLESIGHALAKTDKDRKDSVERLVLANALCGFGEGRNPLKTCKQPRQPKLGELLIVHRPVEDTEDTEDTEVEQANAQQRKL